MPKLLADKVDTLDVNHPVDQHQTNLSPDEVCGGGGEVCAHVEEGQEDARHRLLHAQQHEQGRRLSRTSRAISLGHLRF